MGTCWQLSRPWHTPHPLPTGAAVPAAPAKGGGHRPAGPAGDVAQGGGADDAAMCRGPAQPRGAARAAGGGPVGVARDAEAPAAGGRPAGHDADRGPLRREGHPV